MKRVGTSDRVGVGAVALGLVLFTGIAVLFLVGTAYWVDVRLADVSGTHAAASVRPRDVEPGADVYIETWPVARKSSVRYANGRLVILRDGGELSSTPFTGGGTASPTVTLPPDARPGDRVRIILDVNGAEKRSAFRDQDFRERIDLEVSVVSSSLGGKALKIALAALAWLVAASTCYLLGRSRFGVANLFGRIDVPEDSGSGYVFMFLVILGMLAILATGHIVFARPILLTTSISSVALQASLGAMWVVGLIGGGWLGTRRRREAMRWNRARLRAIEGSRSKLPPTLSRPVEPAPAEAITRALVDAGLEARGRGLIQLVRTGFAIARIRATGAKWAPEDLKIEVLGRHDVSVIADALMPIFGALELLPPFGEPVIVEPRSAS